MDLLLELQKRIPDRWFLRRLLPAALFVVLATVGGGQLGQAHWSDLGRARATIADAMHWTDGDSPAAIASLILVAVGMLSAALVVPFLASVIARLASGAWPWWLTPLGDRLTRWRARRWVSPDEWAKRAVQARDPQRSDARHPSRAARFDARRAHALPDRPAGPTWSGDRLRAAEIRIRERTGLGVADEWARVLLVVPDIARTALTEARDSYDAACEAITWGISVTVLGTWWWPAAPLGIVIWLAAARWLRTAVTGLGQTAEAVFQLYQESRAG